ncbi:MAG: hypothetical protein JWM59_879 [Verrucomicrobiales bacterium]|nr:hypothetical protein [Verrucomicrobiales bacterium]
MDPTLSGQLQTRRWALRAFSGWCLTPVSTVSLATNSSDQDYSIDNLRFAPASEPVTWAYCGGTVLLCLFNRRRVP